MKCAKAIQVLAFGGPDVMQLRDVPIPSVGKGQVTNAIYLVFMKCRPKLNNILE